MLTAVIRPRHPTWLTPIVRAPLSPASYLQLGHRIAEVAEQSCPECVAGGRGTRIEEQINRRGVDVVALEEGVDRLRREAVAFSAGDPGAFEPEAAERLGAARQPAVARQLVERQRVLRQRVFNSGDVNVHVSVRVGFLGGRR